MLRTEAPCSHVPKCPADCSAVVPAQKMCRLTGALSGAECNGVATEAFAAVRTVYSFNGEGRIVQRYQGLLKQPLRAGRLGIRAGIRWG